MENWELLRCTYDMTGLSAIKIEDPKTFKKNIAAGMEESYLLGTVVETKTGPSGKAVIVELEGNKENLEKVLKLIKRQF